MTYVFIKEKLADAHKKRELYRQPNLALVGSGKTTLFNLLTSDNKDTSYNLNEPSI